MSPRRLAQGIGRDRWDETLNVGRDRRDETPYVKTNELTRLSRPYHNCFDGQIINIKTKMAWAGCFFEAKFSTEVIQPFDIFYLQGDIVLYGIKAA